MDLITNYRTVEIFMEVTGEKYVQHYVIQGGVALITTCTMICDCGQNALTDLDQKFFSLHSMVSLF